MKKQLCALIAAISLCGIIVTFSGCSSKTKAPEIKETPKAETRYIRYYNDPEINATIAAAWNHYTNSRYDQSRMDFDRLITKGYTHYDILFGAACANMKYYDLKKALSLYTRCLQERSDHFEALFFRAEIYRQMKDYTRARADLEAILIVEPSSPLICGLYPSASADRNLLLKRRAEVKSILKTM